MYQAKDYKRLVGMKGFSDQLLANHFQLYHGYVENTNHLLEEMAQMHQSGKGGDPARAELKRRLGWEWNGMRLHELYFDNLGGDGSMTDQLPLGKQLARDFGDVAHWEDDFRATAAMRGVGWAILYHDQAGDRLLNMWIDDHDQGHPAGCQPLLVFDAFEHAYLLDYGLERAQYTDAFFRNIDWKVVETRFAR